MKFSSSPARWSELPWPVDEKLSWPGRAFTKAMYSLTVRGGSEGCTTRMCGVALTLVIGTKSRSAVKLSFT